MGDEQEKILLDRLAMGDEAAFRVLYDSYHPRIYSLGMQLTRNAVMAEELVQDVFEKLWKKREQLPQIDHFGAYLKTMVRNTALNQLKRMAHERLILRQLAREAPAAAPPADVLMEQEQFRRLWQESIDRLPPRAREVYLLSRMERLKNAEIAERLGISIYTVKEHLQKAAKLIREHVEGHLDMLVVAAICCFF
jgi:RNA polymerase sigma-70 factor (family 1)